MKTEDLDYGVNTNLNPTEPISLETYKANHHCEVWNKDVLGKILDNRKGIIRNFPKENAGFCY